MMPVNERCSPVVSTVRDKIKMKKKKERARERERERDKLRETDTHKIFNLQSALFPSCNERLLVSC